MDILEAVMLALAHFEPRPHCHPRREVVIDKLKMAVISERKRREGERQASDRLKLLKNKLRALVLDD